jgi:hypothetical protein
MKKITFVGFLFTICLINQNLFSQCNVGNDVDEDGTRYYLHAKEQIYVNEDLENGIQTAFVQLVVIQHPTDNDLLQFVMLIDAGKRGAKKMVVPRQVQIIFTDRSKIALTAESLESPRIVEGISMQQSTFRLNADYYATLQSNSISEIIIIDNREGNQINCMPYKDILKEQANCIALKLKL